MPRDEPLAVVALSESEQGLAEVLHRGEVLRPEELLYKGPDEAPGAAVALGFSHEGRATADSQEAQFGLEVIAHELAAMVVPQGQPVGDLLTVGTEVGPYSLPQGLQRLEARAAAGRVNPHTLRRGVVHRDEDGGRALLAPAGGRVGAPQGGGAI